MSFLSSVYSSAPISIQNLLITAYGYYWKYRRFGKKYEHYLSEFKTRESYSSDQWIEYQTKELRKLLVHSYTHVPFYRELYSNHGFGLRNFSNFHLDQIKKLPFLSKESLRKYGASSLLADNKEKGTFLSSSGSTGTPTQIYFSRDFHQNFSAFFEARVRNWAGVNAHMARGMIGGRRVLPSADNKPPYYRYNAAEKQTYFSAYHISESNVENYLEGIKKNKVEYMIGYAQSNYFLADFIEKKGLEAPKLKAVITSSEKLTQDMRDTFRRVYGCKTFDGYSGVETCGMISENREGDFLFSPDTGIIEVLDDHGKEVDNGEEGEVILTGLLNFNQPLIRYKIGDRIKKAKNQTSKSGLQMPIFSEVMGRQEDVIYSSDGKKMVRFHGIFTDVKGLKFSQLIQESINEFTINLVVDKDYSKGAENIFISRMKSQLGSDIHVQFDYKNEIQVSSNGKYKSVISKL